jgi:hypothetical protein
VRPRECLTKQQLVGRSFAPWRNTANRYECKLRVYCDSKQFPAEAFDSLHGYNGEHGRPTVLPLQAVG